MGVSKYKESAPNCLYHLYNRGNQKRNIFVDFYDYLYFLKRLKENCDKYDFSIIAYCLMPNHFHLLVKQLLENPPSKIMSPLTTSYSKSFNKKYNSIGHLFQDRYKQKIVTVDEYLHYLVDYIHLNPVKENLCKQPEDYPYSSYREHTNTARHRYCDRKLLAPLGLNKRTFLEMMENASQIFPADVFDVD